MADEVKVIKEKKGQPTIIEYKGQRFTLQHPNQYQRGGKK